MLNREQTVAFNILNNGKNVFLTGDAGSGKSYLVRKFIEQLENNGKEVMVCAPTGIAAINVGGVTIHRAFQVPLKPLVQQAKNIPSTLRNVEVIIIEEISMCRMDLFDYIANIIINLNKYRRKNNLKDVQVVVVGDFFQLPPVMNDKDREILTEYYGKNIYGAFAFKSNYWKTFNFVNIILKESMRQKNSEFKHNLNLARIGRLECIRYFMLNSSPNRIKGAITVCGLNKRAREINENEIDKVKSNPVCYIADTKGVVSQSDKMVDDEIVLKVGARVMSVINDTMGRYQNGSLGTIVRLENSFAIVEFDSGETVKIEKYTWEIEDYSLKADSKGNLKLDKTVIGSFSQLPLKIAYAITIHKSQGQTYDAVNIDPYCWDYGQLYVALSRATNIEHMHLLSSIDRRFLKTSLDVKKFYDNIQIGDYLWNR